VPCIPDPRMANVFCIDFFLCLGAPLLRYKGEKGANLTGRRLPRRKLRLA
jgi:hypothetical protein